jgi:hypothetical protein
MATSDEIGQEKQRVSERLARINAERTKLADQLNELEVTERVLMRFGGTADAAERRRRGRPARTAPAVGAQGRARGGQLVVSVSLSDATLQAVKAYPHGATANEILSHLLREFGMAVRPNHLGIALQRHRRAGRLENRDRHWYLELEVKGLPNAVGEPESALEEVHFEEIVDRAADSVEQQEHVVIDRDARDLLIHRAEEHAQEVRIALRDRGWSKQDLEHAAADQFKEALTDSTGSRIQIEIIGIASVEAGMRRKCHFVPWC